jgi:hypothetical protein
MWTAPAIGFRLDLPIDIKSEIQWSLYSLQRDFQPTVPGFSVTAETWRWVCVLYLNTSTPQSADENLCKQTEKS